MKNGGFTLIELIIAVALVGILSSLVTPKVRIQLAKGRDTKAISYLGAMRTAAELYYIEKGEAPTTVISPNEADDKKAISLSVLYFVSCHPLSGSTQHTVVGTALSHFSTLEMPASSPVPQELFL